MLLCLGLKCWIITNAMWVSDGKLEKNNSSASRPPADAPIPTTGKSGCVVRGFGALFFSELEADFEEVTRLLGRDLRASCFFLLVGCQLPFFWPALSFPHDTFLLNTFRCSPRPKLFLWEIMSLKWIIHAIRPWLYLIISELWSSNFSLCPSKRFQILLKQKKPIHGIIRIPVYRPF